MYYKKSELISTHWPLLQILPCTECVNTWGPRTASLPWLTEHRQHIQMGPKQSLLPNSTKTPSPTRVWEALPRMVLRGTSSQALRHRVMGRRDLSGDDRPWRKARGECACTGVRQDTRESDTISDPEMGISGRQCENPLRIWPYLRKTMPDSCSFLFWASSSMSLHSSTMKVENMLLNA